MSLATLSDSGQTGQTCSRPGCYSPAAVFDHCQRHAGPMERSLRTHCRNEGCTNPRSASFGVIIDGLAYFCCSKSCLSIYVRSTFMEAQS